ncbi:winged helix-turn-helix domain-containing protein [Solitalea canadensis]|uniref:Molybdenum-binding protein n=1 Tax=Solitalea canadensis (strain ATCC 29591 / DSM 3403 / JCM 21819 / LMG 8368 / NBRC 15130 / NCIMB 12057 / USAM 9D) TaxID=929556 RepID=H8KN77_SOLCM|nr:winged helix-turn-helix domain-containing protein [Solitalea canadensis]AFD09410.1 molybdenum-binding protein [Solitalea canadensis DSM 3403]
MSQPQFELNGRIWIDTPNGKFLGHGRVELMERIHASGSIRQAALQMKMSYKQAWDLVKYINENIGEPIIISQRGGKGGGRAVITERGLSIIDQYRELQKKFHEFLISQSSKMKL